MYWMFALVFSIGIGALMVALGGWRVGQLFVAVSLATFASVYIFVSVE